MLQKDPVYEAVHYYLGPNEAAKRKVLSAAEVTQDDRGIRELIQAGCYTSAVNLTKQLLTIYGQGAGRAGHLSKHTVHSIQVNHNICLSNFINRCKKKKALNKFIIVF